MTMSDNKTEQGAAKPEDQHATGTEEVAVAATTEDQHATGDELVTMDQHATSEPFKPGK
jgi:uncharacterized protein YabE (DUF348 family)